MWIHMDCVLYEEDLPVVCVCACMLCLYIHVVRHICEGPVVCGGPALANGVYEGHVHTCRCLPAGRELSSRPCSSEDKHRPPARTFTW